ncbi:D-alanyl-D-alanine carboxypeptidase/D-alanyl-D-alanine endopeptidase [Nakamurella alba]|uniref:D-alanyl-D-alanine carboxypeptidase/D-alanyl-D-alanine endopeptidase n=1 Tax=Nakamurella alba TaxID=2665158 RepID=UPI002AC34B4F|nr:D-alanyl-D-alanine carboxypeptidase/D-alanyl-D-alanine-endopeptidase [Nakamurella alba]
MRRTSLAVVTVALAGVLVACTGDPAAAPSSSASNAGATSAAPSSGSSASSSTASASSSSSAAISTSAAAQQIPGLDDSALEVMNGAAYDGGQWAISVKDLETGEQLISHNAGLFLQPGSVVKTYSSGAVWAKFGPDSTVTTPVHRSGEVAGGVLTGDLIMVGQGDLTMGGQTKPDGTIDYTNLDHNDANDIPGATLVTEDPLTGLDALAKQVKDAGINQIKGDVLIDDRLWDADALENGPITPIIINNNLIDFSITPGAVGSKAEAVMRPVVAPWKVDVQVETVAAGGTTNITIDSPAHGQVVLTGSIAADSDPIIRTWAFDDPARFARTAFIEALERAGVTVSADPVAENPVADLPAKDAVTALPVVAERESLPLSEEAKYVLKISYNRGAQTFICRLAVSAGSTDCDDGLTEAAKIWKGEGLDPTGAVLIDGSGLTGNMITADNEADLQRIMAQRPDADEWKATLPILGVDGSLEMVQAKSPAAGKVFAKTGTLGLFDIYNNRIVLPTKALGGYMDAASGRKLAFTIIVTNGVFADIQGVFAANDDVGKVAAIIQQSY